MPIQEKLEQAAAIVRDSGADVWLTIVRETSESADPALEFLLRGGLTWASALMVFATGRRIAVVGNLDAEAVSASGHWHQVVPYVEGIRQPLVELLEKELHGVSDPKIAVNYSVSDSKADGLSHGMYLLLVELLGGTRFRNSLVSAEPIVQAVRSRKTATEISKVKDAIRATEELFASASTQIKPGMSEQQIFNLVQDEMRAKGLGFAWDEAHNPIVNSGPDSMAGHGLPSAGITVQPGHIVHMDLGVKTRGYCSDLQRCWFVGAAVPEDVERAFRAVLEAIESAKSVLAPGIEGWKVDAAARAKIQELRYEEYLHATGHQVGRVAHDGGTLLGPKWPRYGTTPLQKVEQDQIYTLELGVNVPGKGYLGIEEMVLITRNGCEYLSAPQTEIWLI